jgi:multidrug efflux pump subunit AcrA (membrane-fusion protein)
LQACGIFAARLPDLAEDVMPKSRTLGLAAAAVGVCMASGGCGKKAPPQMPPPVVEVVPVVQKDVPVYREAIGTLDGYVNAEIRPQVTGYLLTRAYKEGSLVRPGDPLYVIDPRQFQAALDQAKGDLARARPRSRTRSRPSPARPARARRTPSVSRSSTTPWRRSGRPERASNPRARPWMRRATN